MHLSKTRTYAAAFAACFFLLSGTSASAAQPPTGTLSTQKFHVGGSEQSITAYNIGGYNYLRLRDVGSVLNIAVDYHAEDDSIDIMRDQPYTGDSYRPPQDWPKTVAAAPTGQTVRIGGAAADISGYSIGGYNYFRLRDLGQRLDFSVIYNGALDVVELDKSARYFVQTGNTIILMYHAFCETEEEALKSPSLYTTISRLRENLADLRKAGFESISLADYYAGKADPDKKYFIVTIDDGYMNNYTLAYPVFEQEKVHADIFCVVQDLSGGRDSHFSYALAREMEASDYIAIHSHNLRHERATTFSEGDFMSMLNTAYRSLSVELNKDVLFFAYPYGDHSKSSYQLVKKAGFKLQMVQGRQFPADDILVRMDLYYNTDIQNLIQTAVYN